MAKKKPKAPPAPDVKKMIGASTRANVSTALANTRMAQVNEVGPGGSSTYSQTGTYDYVDPETGATSKMPTFTRTTTLAPGDQRIQDINTQTRTGLSEIGRDQAAFLQDYLANNRAGVQPDEVMRTRYEDALMERMRPRQEQDRAALETRLANQGIGIGSRAYSAADRDFSTGVNDARLAAIGAAGDEQARDFSVRSAARAAPINEVMALLNGAQVQMPNFGAPSRGAPIANTDVAGLMQQGYNNQLGQYGMQMDQYNQRMGGLFGLGASLVSGLPVLSDKRAKDDVEKIGEAKSGLPIYRYRYKGDDKVQIGMMAQDVEKKRPDAVGRAGNMKTINYGKLFNAGGR